MADRLELELILTDNDATPSTDMPSAKEILGGTAPPTSRETADAKELAEAGSPPGTPGQRGAEPGPAAESFAAPPTASARDVLEAIRDYTRTTAMGAMEIRTILEEGTRGEREQATPKAKAEGEEGTSKAKAALGALGTAASSAKTGLEAFAKNDSFTAIGMSAKVAAMGLGALSGVAAPIGVAADTIVAGFKKAEEVLDSFEQRGRQLANYSPELALSTARADIRSTLADIREAQEIGPELAALTDDWSEFKDLLKEGLLPMKKVVVEVLHGILLQAQEFFLQVGITTKAIWELLKDFPEVMARALAAAAASPLMAPIAAMGSIAEDVKKMRKRIEDELDKDPRKDLVAGFMDKQIDALTRGTGVFPFRRDADPVMDPPRLP